MREVLSLSLTTPDPLWFLDLYSFFPLALYISSWEP